MSVDLLLGRVMSLIPLILSLTVHEWAHAYSAFRLGDDTASMQGRMTLNPLVHIDPIGTFVAPLLGVPFGWAKPVPVNPTRFRRGVTMRTGMMITAAAGPLSNLALALLAAVVFGVMIRFGGLEERSAMTSFLGTAIQINVALCIFNFVPVPPLDGSRLVDGLLPYRFRAEWEQVVRYSPFLLLAVVFFGGRYLAGPMSWLNHKLYEIVAIIAA